MHQLAFAVTVHPGEERRTLSVFGLDAGPPGDRLLDNAGIAGIRSVPVGGHVQARRPDGTLLGGTIDYMTPLQFGLRLHGISAIYFVIMETPAAAAPPHGTVNAILSTYGLDDEHVRRGARPVGRLVGRVDAAGGPDRADRGPALQRRAATRPSRPPGGSRARR